MNEKEKELIEKTEWRVQVKGSINTAALNNGNVDAINNTTDNLIEFLEYKFDQAIRTAVEERDLEIEKKGGMGNPKGSWGIALTGEEWQALKGRKEQG